MAENTHENRRNPADHLMQYRWKKGDPSPNPGGRPKRTPYADAHKAIADAFVKDLRMTPTDSVATAIAKAVAREALKGKIQAAKEAADRPKQPQPSACALRVQTVARFRSRRKQLTSCAHASVN